MKRLLVVLCLLAGCVPDQEDMAKRGWTFVGYGPESCAIYKKHDDNEKVTFYATRSYGDRWVVSAVKD